MTDTKQPSSQGSQAQTSDLSRLKTESQREGLFSSSYKCSGPGGAGEAYQGFFDSGYALTPVGEDTPAQVKQGGTKWGASKALTKAFCLTGKGPGE